MTHMVGAQNILKQISPRARRIVEGHEDAYYSGAQGGDYFQLYKNYSMWAGHTYKMYGYALHRARPQRFFVEGAEYIRQSGSDVLKAFFLGYITHYCFDLYMHPDINDGTNAMTTHNTLESAIDVMYSHANGIDALEFDKGAFVEQTTVQTNEINEFFDYAMKEFFYGFKLKPGSYHTTYREFAKFMRYLYKPDKKRLRIMKLRNPFMILNRLTLLYHPVDEIKDWYDYDFYFKLIEKSVAKSVELINLVDEYWNGERDASMLWGAFYNVNFHGKPVTPREERLPFRRMYKKAPLKW